MPAFTYLGRRVNISLAYNTITIYDHSPTGWLKLPMDIFNINGSNTIVIDELTLGHMDYHDDGFSRRAPHYHKQFSFNIDEQIFAQILTKLVGLTALDEREKDSCLTAYHTASHDVEEQFKSCLQTIKLKAEVLAGKAITNPQEYSNTAKVAQDLYATLNMQSEIYFNNIKTRPAYDEFKKNCSDAIVSARELLDQELGFKNIFINLAAAILSLGLIYLAAASINYYQTNGKHFMFKIYQTSSEEELLPALNDLNLSNILPI